MEPTYSRPSAKKLKEKQAEDKTLNIPSFVVYSVGGKVLYHSGKKKASRARARIVNMLLAGSFKRSGNNIRLCQELNELGLRSSTEFTKSCAGTQDRSVKMRGTDTATPWPVITFTAFY